jgi:hypothetical protein
MEVTEGEKQRGRDREKDTRGKIQSEITGKVTEKERAGVHTFFHEMSYVRKNFY